MLEQRHAQRDEELDVHRQKRVLVERDRLDRRVVRPDRGDVMVTDETAGIQPDAGLSCAAGPGYAAGRPLPLLQPAGADQQDVALPDIDALRRRAGFQLGAGDHVPWRETLHAGGGRDVEQDGPAREDPELLYAEPAGARERLEGGARKSVVHGPVREDMRERIEVGAVV